VKLGFVGLGQMGSPIALNLLKSGAELVVSDRDEGRIAPLRDRGAGGTTNAAELADTDILFLCLPNTEVMRSVLTGEGGIIEHLRRGQTVVDLSTIGYGATVEIGRALEATGVAFLDAPVSGMEARAIDGTLTVMCGGARDVFDRVKPYFDCIGTTILHLGPTGSGQLTKLINQLLFDITPPRSAKSCPWRRRWGWTPTWWARWSTAARAAATPRSSSSRASCGATSPTATRWLTPTRTWSAPPSWGPSAASPCRCWPRPPRRIRRR